MPGNAAVLNGYESNKLLAVPVACSRLVLSAMDTHDIERPAPHFYPHQLLSGYSSFISVFEARVKIGWAVNPGL
jgi:hypothetical protein